MKKNLVPLLAIAFAVAVLSTGIFYGLFVGKLKSAPANRIVTAAKPLTAGVQIQGTDLQMADWASQKIPKGMFVDAQKVTGRTLLEPVAEGEPILASSLVDKSGAATGGVPEGMRAVTVHVSDSSGVLAILRPGHRVDVQVFAVRQGSEGEARTAFQNLAVLSVGTQAEPSSQGFNAPVVTLLAEPKDADRLGLADSFGRVRLALRNPGDGGTESKGALPYTALLRQLPGALPVPSQPAPEARNAGNPRAVRSQVALAVRLLSASTDAMTALKRYGVNGKNDVLDAAQVGDIDRILEDLRKNKSLDVLSLSRVNAAISRTAAVELEAREAGSVRVQFSPFLAAGHLRLKVQPEIRSSTGVVPGTHRLETEIDITTGRSFVITGLQDTTSRDTGRQMLVLVTPNL